MVVQEVTIWVVVSFIFCVLLISMKYASDQMLGEFETEFPTAEVTDWNLKISSVWVWLDYCLLFSYVSFVSGSIVLGYFIKSHPVFYVPYMVGSFFITFLAWIFKEVYLEFIASNSAFGILYLTFPKTQYFMNNLPYFVLIASVIIATFQYSHGSDDFVSYY